MQTRLNKKTLNPLHEILIQRIQHNGPISVADYMSAALSHPKYGYYMTRSAIGMNGDFTTAPEISQMFGEIIAAWLADIRDQSGRPDDVQLIELGPGRGTLCADILRVFSLLGIKASVHLVETSPQMRDAQKKKLWTYHPTWYERLEDVPKGFSLIIANEFFDALPVQQYEMTKAGWQERMVDIDDQNTFIVRASGPALEKTPGTTGDVFEKSPVAQNVMHVMAERIQKYGGGGLVIDYGYDIEGFGDTLQAVSKHRYANAFENPGTQDITAHVNFTSLKNAALPHVNVHGPVSQGHFLSTLGIVQRGETLHQNATESEQKDIQTALYRLTSIKEMGRIFKVMGLTQKGPVLNVAGFK